MLNTEGMLHIAFNGAVYKKSQSGLLTRGNTIRQKGKIFSTRLRMKLPGKWFLGDSLAPNRERRRVCKPTCCLLSHPFNEYTGNCSRGTKKAQIGGKISASAPAHCRIITRHSDTGGCRRPDSIGAQIWAVFMPGAVLEPSPVHKSAGMKGKLGQFSRPGLILVRPKIE